MVQSINSNYPKNIIITSDNKKYQKPSTLQTIAGIYLGTTVGAIATQALSTATRIPYKKFLYNNENFLQENAPIFKDAVAKAFEKSNISSAGYRIYTPTRKLLNETIRAEIPEIIKKIPYIKNYIIKQNKPTIRDVLKGQNALCTFKTKRIFVDQNKLAIAAFHEMGHAMNSISSAKILQKLHIPGLLIAGVAGSIGIFKRKKADGEKPKNTVDKITTFIKNNAGKLVALGTLPMLIEETMASVKGAKLAKEFLTPELYKLTKKYYAIASLGYLGIAAGYIAYISISKFCKDKIAAPKKIDD